MNDVSASPKVIDQTEDVFLLELRILSLELRGGQSQSNEGGSSGGMDTDLDGVHRVASGDFRRSTQGPDEASLGCRRTWHGR